MKGAALGAPAVHLHDVLKGPEETVGSGCLKLAGLGEMSGCVGR